MKKTAIILGALLASLSLSPANAADTKSLVIIDSYFDSRVIGGNVSCVAIENNLPCADVVTATSTLMSNEINHGDGMVEVAKRQNSTIKIIALRSGFPTKTSVSGVTPARFIDALRWVNNNSTTVGAVSFSRYFNHATKPCMPMASSPYTPETADLEIKKLISTLSSKGIPVFVATGNKLGAPVDYPACLTAINSVSVGSLNKLGQTISSYSFDANTDYFASASVYSYKSSVFGLIPNTTSAGNVAVAAKYLSGFLDNKFVNVLQ